MRFSIKRFPRAALESSNVVFLANSDQELLKSDLEIRVCIVVVQKPFDTLIDFLLVVGEFCLFFFRAQGIEDGRQIQLLNNLKTLEVFDNLILLEYAVVIKIHGVEHFSCNRLDFFDGLTLVHSFDTAKEMQNFVLHFFTHVHVLQREVSHLFLNLI